MRTNTPSASNSAKETRASFSLLTRNKFRWTLTSNSAQKDKSFASFPLLTKDRTRSEAEPSRASFRRRATPGTACPGLYGSSGLPLPPPSLAGHGQLRRQIHAAPTTNSAPLPTLFSLKLSACSFFEESPSPFQLWDQKTIPDEGVEGLTVRHNCPHCNLSTSSVFHFFTCTQCCRSYKLVEGGRKLDLFHRGQSTCPLCTHHCSRPA